jgi:hypothetical protein
VCCDLMFFIHIVQSLNTESLSQRLNKETALTIMLVDLKTDHLIVVAGNMRLTDHTSQISDSVEGGTGEREGLYPTRSSLFTPKHSFSSVTHHGNHCQ